MTDSTNINLPIGIFDSGIGGLTVLRALQHALPSEDFLYLGDTARLPYGTKSPETIRQYALQANEILISRGVKALVIACNTATAVALDILYETFYPLPVFGVIVSGAKAALTSPKDGPIVVLATESTVKGHAYRQVIQDLAPEREVMELPCQLMVALAEEGWCEGPLVEQIIIKMLSPFLSSSINPSCYLLGCTHFPVLKSAVQAAVGEGVTVIDPALQVAIDVTQQLDVLKLRRQIKTPGTVQFLATDGCERFARVAQTFLGKKVTPDEVELVYVINPGVSSQPKQYYPPQTR